MTEAADLKPLSGVLSSQTPVNPLSLTNLRSIDEGVKSLLLAFGETQIAADIDISRLKELYCIAKENEPGLKAMLQEYPDAQPVLESIIADIKAAFGDDVEVELAPEDEVGNEFMVFLRTNKFSHEFDKKTRKMDVKYKKEVRDNPFFMFIYADLKKPRFS